MLSKNDENFLANFFYFFLFFLLTFYLQAIRATNTEITEKSKKIAIANVSRETFIHQITDTTLNHHTIKNDDWAYRPPICWYQEFSASVAGITKESAIYRPIAAMSQNGTTGLTASGTPPVHSRIRTKNRASFALYTR